MPRRITVVEDDALQRNLYSDLVRACGHLPDPVDSCREALSRLSGPPPDLVILDVSLGDGSGQDVLAAIRGHDAWAMVPVIMMSGRLDLDWDPEPDGDAPGAVARDVTLLTKPFDIADFRAAIDRCLRADGQRGK